MRGVEGESQGQPERERSQRTERPLPASTRSAANAQWTQRVSGHVRRLSAVQITKVTDVSPSNSKSKDW